MRLRLLRQRARTATGCVFAALLLGGCAQLVSHRPSAPPPGETQHVEDRDTTAAVIVGGEFQTMERLAQASPAEQSEIVANARSNYEHTPHGSAQLQYALLLATPGHVGRDAVAARDLLRALAAQPESLTPVERAVALIELSQLNRELDLQSESERLQLDAQHTDREHQAQAQRRLQTEQEENSRLRKQLEDAQAKLDAVANIERNMSATKPAKEGHAP